jgi:hypothetical protein
MKTKRSKKHHTSRHTRKTKHGVPCGMVVTSISRKTGKNVNVIFKSLCKAGLCKGQKINGQWIYWPTLKVRTNISNAKASKVKMWQCFVDWCTCSGICTTRQITGKSTTSASFAKFCKTWFGKTVTAGGTTRTKSHKTRKHGKKRTITMRRTTIKRNRRWTTGRKTWASKWTTKRHTTHSRKRRTNKSWRTWGSSRNYKFPTFKTRTNWNYRRYSRAA